MPTILSLIRTTHPVRLCDRLICAVLMLDVFILPFSKRYFLHILCVALLALLWITKMRLLKQGRFQRTPLDVPILLFVAWGLLSALLSTHPRYSLGEWRTEMVTYFFFFYLVVTHVKDRAAFRAVHGALMVGAALMACAGIDQFVSAGGAWNVRGVRISALSSDYNYASSYFILAIPMILYALMTATSIRRKALFGLLLGMNLLALYFTFTRAAWLGLGAGLLALGLLMGKRRFVPAVALVGLIVLLLVTTPKGAAFYRNMDGSNDLGRIATWSWGVGQITQHPLFGIGYGRENMRMTFPEQTDATPWNVWHLHNTFLETTLEMGIPGGLFLLLLLVLLLRLLVLGYWQAHHAEDRWLMATLVMMMVAYFVRNQFDHLYVDAPALLFWIFMGFGVSRMRLMLAEGEEASQMDRPEETALAVTSHLTN